MKLAFKLRFEREKSLFKYIRQYNYANLGLYLGMTSKIHFIVKNTNPMPGMAGQTSYIEIRWLSRITIGQQEIRLLSILI